MSIYETHTTRDGDEIPVCMMNDGHLLNTIKLHCRRMKEAQAILRRPAQTVDNTVLQALAGKQYETLSRRQKEMATDAIRSSDESLGSYVLAAMLRPGIAEQIPALIQDAYGLAGAVPNPDNAGSVTCLRGFDKNEDYDQTSHEFDGYYDEDDY